MFLDVTSKYIFFFSETWDVEDCSGFLVQLFVFQWSWARDHVEGIEFNWEIVPFDRGFCTSQPEKYMLQNQIITCYRIWKKYMLQSRTNTCYRIRQIYVTEYTRSCGEKRIESGACHLIRGFVHVRGDIGLFVHLRVRIGLLPLNWVENRTGNKKGSFTVLFVDCFIHCGALATCTVQVVHHLILLLVKRELRNLKNIHNPTSIILFIKVQFNWNINFKFSQPHLCYLAKACFCWFEPKRTSWRPK